MEFYARLCINASIRNTLISADSSVRLLRRPGDAAAAGSARQVQDGIGVRPGLGQHADRLRCGQDDQVDLAAAGLVPDLLHDRQRAIRAGADHQPAASPRDVLLGRERSVPVRTAELPRGDLLRLRIVPWSMIRSWS